MFCKLMSTYQSFVGNLWGDWLLRIGSLPGEAEAMVSEVHCLDYGHCDIAAALAPPCPVSKFPKVSTGHCGRWLMWQTWNAVGSVGLVVCEDEPFPRKMTSPKFCSRERHLTLHPHPKVSTRYSFSQRKILGVTSGHSKVLENGSQDFSRVRPCYIQLL